MIEKIVPPQVAAAEVFGDVAGATLFPAEEAAIASAAERRRREFTAGRACARAALSRLGLPPAPILRGARGEPKWPAGVVGSITHCAGYRASAVARAGDLVTLGIDAEPDSPLPEGVLDLVATAAERASLRQLGMSAPGTCWDRLLFSAKESVYKAWFPVTGRWLGFEQAAVTIGPAAGTFTARLMVPGPERHDPRLDELTGRWLARNGLVVTVVTVPA